MPQNMQKRESKVAALDLDQEGQLVSDGDNLLAEADGMSVEDERYTAALKYLKRGLDSKTIADKLVKDGMPRVQAARLARRVYKENPQERRMNAYILFGVAAFSGVLGIVFLAIRVINEGTLPIFAPAYLLLIGAIWFAYKGWKEYRQIK